MTDSRHLDEIMNRHHRVANLQVVFVDIEKYSKRRTKTQTEVIDRFTLSLMEAIVNSSKEFITYAQANNVNFQDDIITIPTGDGAAIVFSFNGLSEIHLFFAKSLLEEIDKLNRSTPCDKYNEHGWCNCHANFGLRIGISQDTGIIYRDINDNYNVAGTVINLAARVMGLGDKNQIIFTQVAYKQIIDMVDDPNLVDLFVEFTDVNMKHGLVESVYQYIGAGEPYISTVPPERLALHKRLDVVTDKISSIMGIKSPLNSTDSEGALKLMLGKLEGVVSAMAAFSDSPEIGRVIDVEPKTKAMKDVQKTPQNDPRVEGVECPSTEVRTKSGNDETS